MENGARINQVGAGIGRYRYYKEYAFLLRIIVMELHHDNM